MMWVVMFARSKVALLVLLAACSVGEVPLEGTPDAAPSPNQLSFASTITPLVTECISCHSAVTPPNLTSFDALGAAYKAKPGANNILVIKGDATAGQHQGLPYFTAAEKTTVAGWIDGLQP
jgi:hypothetical protein